MNEHHTDTTQLRPCARRFASCFGLPLLSAMTLLLVLTAQVHAATATADMMSGGSDVSLVFGQGTSTLYAYTEVKKPTQSGPNSTSSINTNGTSAGVLTAAGQSITVKRGIVNQNSFTYSPVVGVTNSAKPPIPNGQNVGTQTVYSTSAPQGGGSAKADAGFQNWSGRPDAVVASGTLTAPPQGVLVGAAAASAVDPISIAPGVYPYAQSIDVSLQLDNLDQTGGVALYALDSRLTNLDSFFASGEPLDQALWAMTIFANNVPNSLSDLTVQFYINPLARSMGILNPSYSDSQIATNVESAVRIRRWCGFAGRVQSVSRGHDVHRATARRHDQLRHWNGRKRAADPRAGGLDPAGDGRSGTAVEPPATKLHI